MKIAIQLEFESNQMHYSEMFEKVFKVNSRLIQLSMHLGVYYDDDDGIIINHQLTIVKLADNQLCVGICPSAHACKFNLGLVFKAMNIKQ